MQTTHKEIFQIKPARLPTVYRRDYVGGRIVLLLGI